MEIKKLVSLIILFLTACTALASPPVETPSLTVAPTFTATAIPSATHTTAPTSPPPTPTVASVSLPDGLLIAYIVDDAIWLWKQGQTQLLLQMPHIFTPLLSDDGQWLLFMQEHLGEVHFDEIWAMRTDGSELHRLLTSEDLTSLAGGDVPHFIHEIDWLPGRHELMFTTEEQIEGPPERWPAFDLFVLDLSGKVTRLAEAGRGGLFAVSPDGLHVAVASDTSIGILDLESGRQRARLRFEPLWMGCECLSIPKIAWDSQSRFVMTSIPPQKLHYPEYAGEPEKVWRLFANGKAELITQFQPLALGHGITVAPNARYFFYLEGSCPDAMVTLHLYDLASAKEIPLFCVWSLPWWTPDSEHFLYSGYDGSGPQRLGSVSDIKRMDQPLEYPITPSDPEVDASGRTTWINDTYFLSILHNHDDCALNVVTLAGIVTEIVRTPPDPCLQADFSLSH